MAYNLYKFRIIAWKLRPPQFFVRPKFFHFMGPPTNKTKEFSRNLKSFTDIVVYNLWKFQIESSHIEITMNCLQTNSKATCGYFGNLEVATPRYKMSQLVKKNRVQKISWHCPFKLLKGACSYLYKIKWIKSMLTIDNFWLIVHVKVLLSEDTSVWIFFDKASIETVDFT